MLTFYDLESTNLPSGQGWSPNTRKTKYTLEFKGLPYSTVFTVPGNLVQTCKGLNAPPTGIRKDGTPRYTHPMLHDSTTGKAVTESFRIAEYLDERFPDTPRAIPEGTLSLQFAFVRSIEEHYLVAFGPLVLPKIYSVVMGGPGAKYAEIFKTVWETNLGRPFAELGADTDKKRAAAWKNFAQGLDWIEKCILQNGPDAKYLLGDMPCFSDFVIAGRLFTLRTVFGEESEDWKNLSQWNNGRWVRYLEDMENIGKKPSKL